MLVIGSIFLILGGLIYTVERITSLIVWAGIHLTDTDYSNVQSNVFIYIFSTVGIGFILYALRSGKWVKK